MTSLSRTPFARSFTALLLALVLGAAACASDSDAPADGPGEGQPGVEAGAPVDAELADVPVPEAAVAVGEVVDQDGVQTQSYIVTATSPELVIDFYDEQLDELGWDMLDRTAFNTGLRATWTQDDDELLITANPDGQDTELNIQLADA